jgi:hypothetical protein
MQHEIVAGNLEQECETKRRALIAGGEAAEGGR